VTSDRSNRRTSSELWNISNEFGGYPIHRRRKFFALFGRLLTLCFVRSLRNSASDGVVRDDPNSNELDMNYGKALKLARALASLSQKDLAARARLDPSYVSLIENGTRKPSLTALEKLSKALKIPNDLLVLMAAEEKDLALRNPAELQRAVEAIARLVLQYAPSKSTTRRTRRIAAKA
jgi:transcriptional regulator with XRE-family HTH domain